MTTNSSAEELMESQQTTTVVGDYSQHPDEIEIIISKAEDGKTTIKPRRCRLSRHCLSATILAIISVSLLIGATLYLLIGNIPTFAGMQVQLDQSGEAQGLDITAQSLPLSIRLNLIVTGTLDSQSYISYIVNSLTVKVYLVSANVGDDKPLIGTTQTNSIEIPARSTIKISMPFSMNIKGSLDNPLVRSILDSCGIGNEGGGKSPIIMQYQVFADVFMLHGMHVMSDQMSFDCPDLNGMSINVPLLGGINVGQAVSTVEGVAGAVGPVAGAVVPIAGQIGETVTSPPVQNAVGQMGGVLSGILGRK